MGRDNFNTQLLRYIENAKDVFVILEDGSLDACKSSDWEKDWFCAILFFANITVFSAKRWHCRDDMLLHTNRKIVQGFIEDKGAGESHEIWGRALIIYGIPKGCPPR